MEAKREARERREERVEKTAGIRDGDRRTDRRRQTEADADRRKVLTRECSERYEAEGEEQTERTHILEVTPEGDTVRLGFCSWLTLSY